MSLADTLMYATNGSGSVAPLQHDGSSNLKVSVENSLSIDTTGLATDTGQATANGHLSTIAGAVSGSEMQVDIVSSSGTISVDGSGATQPISASFLPLPSGASTSANQSIANGHLSALEGALFVDGGAITGSDEGMLIMGRDNSNNAHPLHITNNGDLEVEIADFVKGQTLMASSFPVVLASDQSAIEVNPDKSSASSSLWSSSSIPASSTNNQSGVLDFQGYSVLQVIGNTTNTSDPIYMEFSTDNTTFYKDTYSSIYPDFSSGDFVVSFNDVACRYVRAVKDNNGAAETITLLAVVRKN